MGSGLRLLRILAPDVDRIPERTEKSEKKNHSCTSYSNSLPISTCDYTFHGILQRTPVLHSLKVLYFGYFTNCWGRDNIHPVSRVSQDAHTISTGPLRTSYRGPRYTAE